MTKDKRLELCFVMLLIILFVTTLGVEILTIDTPMNLTGFLIGMFILISVAIIMYNIGILKETMLKEEYGINVESLEESLEKCKEALNTLEEKLKGK